MFLLEKINKADTENQQADQAQNTDLSAYVLSYTWSGDVEQAGRKLEFDLAIHEGQGLDECRPGTGDEVCLSYTMRSRRRRTPFSREHLFRSRDSKSYAMRFVAFDNIIYLAKSRITRKYANVTVADAIRQTIHDFSIEAGRCRTFLWYAVSLPMTSQQLMPSKQALSYQSAQDGKGYHIYMTDGIAECGLYNDQVVEELPHQR